jgi:PAS domain-containing protein
MGSGAYRLFRPKDQAHADDMRARGRPAVCSSPWRPGFREWYIRGLSKIAVYPCDLSSVRSGIVKEAIMDSSLAAKTLAPAGEAIVTVDATAKVTSWNPAAERLFGHAESAMVGHSVAVIIPEAFRPRHVAAFHAALGKWETGRRRLAGAGGRDRGGRHSRAARNDPRLDPGRCGAARRGRRRPATAGHAANFFPLILRIANFGRWS